jgi:hypothetical protein
MRSFIIAAAASFVLTAAACAIAAWAMWGREHVGPQSAGSLHAVSAHHVRSIPLWIPG